MTRAIALLLLASITAHVEAASMSDAFTDGANFGRSNNAGFCTSRNNKGRFFN